MQTSDNADTGKYDYYLAPLSLIVGQPYHHEQ